MVEYSAAIAAPIRRNVAVLAMMKLAVFVQVLFAELVLGTTSPLSNINPSSPCTPKDTTYGITIWTQGDADAVSNCSSISSDLFIDFTFPGKLRLDVLVDVNGNLGAGLYSPNRTYFDGSNYVTNTTGTSALIEASFYNLMNVGGYLAFGSTPTLLNVSLPQIQNITANLTLEDLPSLTTFDCGSSLTFVDYATLISGTALQTLTIGSGYSGSYINGDVTILNNTKLNQLLLSIVNITGTVYIDGLYDISFGNLEGVTGNLTIINANSISLDYLNWVGQSIGIYSSDYLTNFSAPQLTNLDGDLLVLDNAALKNVSIPTLLQMPGGIEMINNTALQNISGFPQLRDIERNVDIEGPLDEVSFPQLRNFYGTNFTVSSSHSDLNCTNLDAYAHSNPAIIRGSYTCAGAATSTTGIPSSSMSSDTSPTSSLTDSGGLSIGAKAGIGVGVVLAFALITALVLGWFLLKRRKRVYQGVQTVPPDYVPETPQGDYYGKVEPSGNGSPVEADSGRPVNEVSSNERPGELESRPVDDIRHTHHSDAYEGPTPVENTRVSRLTDYEVHTPVEETGHSHHAHAYEMLS